jgi:hypothetical protein
MRPKLENHLRNGENDQHYFLGDAWEICEIKNNKQQLAIG